jgi:hypothetical protein
MIVLHVYVKNHMVNTGTIDIDPIDYISKLKDKVY